MRYSTIQNHLKILLMNDKLTIIYKYYYLSKSPVFNLLQNTLHCYKYFNLEAVYIQFVELQNQKMVKKYIQGGAKVSILFNNCAQGCH